MTKFSKAPGSLLAGASGAPAKKISEQEKAFIEGANKPPASAFPWEGLDNERLYPAFSLRLTDAQHAKLQFASSKLSGVSMHKFCVEATMLQVDAMIDEYLNKASK